MPALVVWGHRVPLVAEDDVRTMSKYAFFGRMCQVGLWIPSMILIMVRDRKTRSCIPPEEEEEEESHTLDRFITNSAAVVPSNEIVLRTFVFLSMTTIFVSCVLDTIIFRVSSRGAPVQVEKRKPLRRLCAIKLFPFTVLRLVTMVFAIYSVWIVQEFCNQCGSSSCIRGTVEIVSALGLSHVIDVAFPSTVILLFLCRTAHAQTSYYMQLLVCGSSSKKSNPKGSFWKIVCQCCCACTSITTCCLFGGFDVIADSAAATPSSLSDVSVALADYFNTTSSRSSGSEDDTRGNHPTLDVTLSDIHVGLYALAAEQRTSRRQRWKLLQRDQQQQQQEQSSEKGNKDTNNGVICRSVVGTSVAVGTFSSFDILDVEIGSEHPDEEEGGIVGENPPPAFVLDFRLRRDMTHARTYFEPTKRRKLEKTNREDNRIIQEGAHYMRYALAVYGHLMYMFQQPCTAPCRLACDFVTGKISHCCFSKGHEMKNTVVGDNFLGCNKSAFLQISDIDEEDVIYMSFKNAINVLPYVILVDREKNAVVLAIRGTFSLEGLVTDFRIRPEPLDNYQVQYPGLGGTIDTEGEFCHSGFLHSALAIYEDLERHQILNRLLLGDSSQLPGFSLVLTGHSLGAGCAAVLSLMLRTKFDGLQCYCFSPPGCVFSDKASSQDHIVSYVLDSDIVPCLSLHSMNGLRDDILLMIARLKIPKHEVWKKVSKSDNDAEYESWTSGLAHSRESIPDSAFYRHLLDFLRMQVTLQENHQIASVQLRPPGKMVHLIASHNQGSSFFDRAPRQKTYVPVYAERSDFSEIQITRSFLYYHDPFLVLTQLQRIADVFK